MIEPHSSWTLRWIDFPGRISFHSLQLNFHKNRFSPSRIRFNFREEQSKWFFTISIVTVPFTLPVGPNETTIQRKWQRCRQDVKNSPRNKTSNIYLSFKTHTSREWVRFMYERFKCQTKSCSCLLEGKEEWRRRMKLLFQLCLRLQTVELSWVFLIFLVCCCLYVARSADSGTIEQTDRTNGRVRVMLCVHSHRRGIRCIIHFSKKNKYLLVQWGIWRRFSRSACWEMFEHVEADIGNTQEQPMMMKGYYASQWERK